MFVRGHDKNTYRTAALASRDQPFSVAQSVRTTAAQTRVFGKRAEENFGLLNYYINAWSAVRLSIFFLAAVLSYPQKSLSFFELAYVRSSVR